MYREMIFLRKVRILSLLLSIGLLLALCNPVLASGGEAQPSEIMVSAPPTMTTETAETENEGDSFVGSIFTNRASIAEMFQEMFTTTITNFFSGIVNNAFDFVTEYMTSYLTGVFHAENWVNSGTSTILTAQTINDAYTFIYVFACALVALKFIFKGFQIYILWRNGDADSSPREMLVGVAEAAVVMVAFPWAYERGVDVCLYLANGILGQLGLAEETIDVGAVAGKLSPIRATADHLIILAFLLVYVVLVFIIWIRLMKLGFELLVMRLGIPLAALGLIDSDMALFKNYIQVFFKVALTVIIQVALMLLSFRVVVIDTVKNVFPAIALITTAMGAPALLQQFLAPQSPGNGMQKVYTLAMIGQATKRLFV